VVLAGYDPNHPINPPVPPILSPVKEELPPSMSALLFTFSKYISLAFPAIPPATSVEVIFPLFSESVTVRLEAIPTKPPASPEALFIVHEFDE